MDDISQLNLRVLKRHNPYIASLIDKSSYCVIYTFSTASASWTKAGYEGTLFIYSQEPHIIQTEYGEEEGGEFGFCVMNRLNLENFWEVINGGDIVLDEQYIITRSLTGGTYPFFGNRAYDRCIWIMVI
jgi:Dcp1-like decapping family